MFSAWISKLLTAIGVETLMRWGSALFSWIMSLVVTKQNEKDKTDNADIEEKLQNAKTREERQAALDAAARKRGRRP